MHLAAQDPASVRALILSEPVLWDTISDQVLGGFRRWREVASLGKTAGEIREIWGRRNAHDRARAVWLSQLDPGTLTAVIDKTFYEGFEAETTLKRISSPVLLIYGDPAKGSVLSREQVEAIRSAIPDCVADLVDAGSHPRSDRPMKTLQILMHFLESL